LEYPSLLSAPSIWKFLPLVRVPFSDPLPMGVDPGASLTIWVKSRPFIGIS
jgi:hypothetical protein